MEKRTPEEFALERIEEAAQTGAIELGLTSIGELTK